MQRHSCHPRTEWCKRVDSVGLTYHSHDDGPYWDESVCYELTAREVDVLETAANQLHYLCIDAAEAVINHKWWSRLGIPEAAVPAILRSWDRDDFSLYGRFDFSFDGVTPPKLLEYNADTPTALVEAAVAQWFWLQDTFPRADQFNSIHEKLIAAWKKLAPQIPKFFSEVILADITTDGDKRTHLWSTNTANVVLKNRSLPISSKLPPTFGPIVEAYKKRLASIS